MYTLLVANQGFYTALFKFPCFSSCLPKDSYHLAQIIFTLEYRNDILGRACVDIRVCASPGRDRKVAEEAIETPPANKKCKRKGIIDNELVIKMALEVILIFVIYCIVRS